MKWLPFLVQIPTAAAATAAVLAKLLSLRRRDHSGLNDFSIVLVSSAHRIPHRHHPHDNPIKLCIDSCSFRLIVARLIKWNDNDDDDKHLINLRDWERDNTEPPSHSIASDILT